MSFIGRDAELDALSRETALALELSAGRALFLVGPPGSGKTSLAAALLQRVAAERPEVAIARGRCLQTFGSGDPYLPFVSALEDLANESTAGFIRKETLRSLLGELAPYWLSVVPVVGNLLSAAAATATRLRAPAPQNSAPSREALFGQYLEVIKRLARRGPLLLFLDDLHWADPSSVALLARLARGIEHLPAVVIGTLRTGETDQGEQPTIDVIRELEREELGRQIEIGELDAPAVAALLAAELGGDIAEPLHHWVLETAGGNPLFVTELARLLQQSGAVVEEHGEWGLTDAVEGVGVPRTAEAVIERRIQRLEPEAVRTLQYASVAGDTFDSVTLAALLEADELTVLDTLDRAERQHRLVEATGELELPNGELASGYRFCHALVQTVLYAQVLGKRRVLLHRKAGELLEAAHGPAADAVAARLARHFHRGRLPERAHAYARLAAGSAQRVHAYWEAESLYRLALETSSDGAVHAEIEERLGEVYDALGRYERGLECFARALALRPGDGAAALRLGRKSAVLSRRAGTTPARVLLQRVRDLLRDAEQDAHERCHLLLELASITESSGALEAAEAAVRIAEGLGDAVLLATALQQLATLHVFRSGQVERAFPVLRRAEAIVTALDDPQRSALHHNIAGIAHARIGEYESARREFDAMLEIAERLGDPRKIGVACNNVAVVLLRLGAYAEAEPLLQRARTIHSRRDREATLIQSLFNLAERARLTGDFATAIACYQEMLDRAGQLEYWSSEAVAQAGICLCLLGAGRADEAREMAHRAVVTVADRDEWFEDRNLYEVAIARIEVLDDQPGAAVQRLRHTAEMLRTVDIYLWALVAAELAGLLCQHAPADAWPVFAELVEAARRIESPVLHARIGALREILPAPVVPEGVA